ncbi:MAG: MATE family efflux transporter [Planctomycetaceae bacterium]|jgi:MATE family multidrug resistance protein|nr:MATE family efflux transporter [Planctomycetaceae bacterium]
MIFEKILYWWSRPAGWRDVLAIAVPMIISSGSWAIMNFADRVMLTWYSENTAELFAHENVAQPASEIAAAATGAATAAGSLYLVITSLPLGIMMLINAFVSQYYGAGKPHRIGPVVWQGAFFGMILLPVYVLLEPVFASVFSLMKHEPGLIVLEKRYMHFALYGVGAQISAESIAAFFIGRGKTRTVMSVNIVSDVANVLIGFPLIFGRFGFPELGTGGAALATTICMWFRFLAFFSLMFVANGRNDQFCVLRGRRIDLSLIRRIFRFGFPGGVEYMFETISFSAFIMLMGTLNPQALSATAIAFSLNSLSFLPLIGMGIAVMSIVGRYLGENHPELAQRATLTALTLGLISNSFFVILFLFFPNSLLYAYMMFSDAESFAPLHDMTVIILRFIAIYLLFDGVNIVFMSAIKGAGDTLYLLFATLIMAPILAGTCLLFIWLGFGVYACWTILTVWTCAYAGIYGLRFFQGKWKKMRVIEQDYTAE